MKLSKKSMSVALLAMAFAVVASGCGKVQVGYVDQSKLTTDAPQIKATVEEWQQKNNELTDEGNKALQEAASKNASQDEITKIQTQYQAKAMALQQSYQTQLKTKVDEVIEGIATEKKLDVVLDSGDQKKQVISGGTDITDEVIQKLQ